MTPQEFITRLPRLWNIPDVCCPEGISFQEGKDGLLYLFANNWPQSAMIVVTLDDEEAIGKIVFQRGAWSDVETRRTFSGQPPYEISFSLSF